VPFALKAIGGLIVVAVVFIVAAVLGGSHGGGNGPSPSAPAPASGGGGGGAQPAAEAAAQLGYPAFATKDTTRVGGADPASTAAAVALAVFPSTAPAQRPAAVTLASEGDWQGAVAAAVLMAEPVRAPLLFSSPGGVPGATSEALEALAPRGSGATEGAQAFSIGGVAVPGGLKTTAVEASSAPVEAAAIERLRDRLVGAPPRHVVVAPAGDPGTAMPAAAWAARSGDPVLYAEGAQLPAATAGALKLHPKAPVYVLGPASVVSPKVLREIAAIDPDVHRVAGPDPVANAIALARYSAGGFGWNVNDPGHGFVVARDDAPLDAAAAAPLSASGTWGPLLLTGGPDKVPAALRGYLLDVKPGYTTDPTRAFYNHVWVIGDEAAIGVSQQAEIDSLAELGKIGGEP
jgi:Cell wall binding domain 2 (CWB2)